ncbi:MAG TPA: SDR family NAD(P)-dependent oxidoreductase [Acidimicrobiales bacterium]|nr:SDR family NAD(P)-dependent oxidoreductase [Acidimicrobiales bacterium]
MSSFDLQGATAVVTGASRGIGPHIAATLVKHGMRVGLVARSRPELEMVAQELRHGGAAVVPVVGDVTSSDDRHRIIEAVEHQFGPVDVLVNNAGGDAQRQFHNLTEADLVGIIDLNLTSAVILSHIVLPGMLSRGRGHIVNVSSMAGRTSFPFTEAYAAAKDGMIAFTRVLRADYRRAGVSASTMILGPVREAGVGARTSEEMGTRVPRAVSVSPAQIGRATVKAVRKDKAELVLVPGPGKALRAMMDRFPGLGPAMNRAGGAEKTMRAVADHREGQVNPGDATPLAS